MLDLVIVGSGPAGLSCASHAHANGLRYTILERTGHIADTVHNYQARKFVMAEPGAIPRRGELPFAAGSRESVLAGWQKHVDDKQLNVVFNTGVHSIERRGDALVVGTADGTAYETRAVVLAVGTQGDPRTLRVPGEQLPHVAYRLADPAEHHNENIVVVGGGDSALEIALALADRNRVHIVMLEPEITYANEILTREVLARQASGRITIYYNARVSSVFAREAELDVKGETLRVPADRIFVKIGADPPRKFFEKIGIRYAGEGRDARPILTAAHETTVRGVFLIGAAAGRGLIKPGINSGFEVVEHLMGREIEPADEALLRERLPFWEGTVHERIAAIRHAVPLLAAADEMIVRETLLSAQVAEYGDGDVIFRKDDYTTDLLIVVSGRVETKQSEIASGDFFGERSLISGRRRDTTARAIGPARVIAIPRKAALKLLANAPEASALVDQAFLLRFFTGRLFHGIEQATIAGLAAQATIEKFRKGAVIYREGDPADAIYLIRNGMVKLTRHANGKDAVLSYFVAGKVFGDGALVFDAKHTVTVTAVFSTEVIRLSREAVHGFLAGHPSLREALLKRSQERWVASLVAEATPGSGAVLENLIDEEVVMGTHTLLIDEYRCVRCGNCVRACAAVHDDSQPRVAMTGIRIYNLLAPNSCWHCENPLCMLDCPPDAITRDPRGEIYIDTNCIGCGNCARHCPYGNIFMVHRDERTVAVKCDLCRTLAHGPACVRSCPTGAATRITREQYRSVFDEMVNS